MDTKTTSIRKEKRPYKKPELLKLGLLREVTQGGSGPNNEGEMCEILDRRVNNPNCLGG